MNGEREKMEQGGGEGWSWDSEGGMKKGKAMIYLCEWLVRDKV